jgi:hypothetical protein
MDTHQHRLLVDVPADVELVAREIAAGTVVGTAFGNFYVIVTRPDDTTVRRVNVAKGRPVDQVGSVTTAFERIPATYDWSQLPANVPVERIQALMDALWSRGPFGFRGPAAKHVPDHLTQVDQGVRTVQVIAPGRFCPSNHLFARAVDRLGADLLYITSANRSRHVTGADEEPAHWQGADLAADFAHVGGFLLLEHRDEAAARAAYPGYAPTSVTLLSFHAVSAERGRPVLTIDRHGSLPIEEIRPVARWFGFDVTLAPRARNRLRVRSYPQVVPA